MPTPDVSVVVPHYQDLVRLDACLAALGRQRFSGTREIIVADNGSPEGEPAVAAVVAGRARLVVVAERGAGPARNGGVAVSTGTLLAFTDADCVPEPDWLDAGARALGDYDLVGGAVTVTVADPNAVTSTEAFERIFAFRNDRYVRDRGFSVTANLFCHRRVFEAVGGFKVGVPEDVEWCHRAVAGGFRLGYAGDAIVGHPARRNWPELSGKWRRLSAEAYGLLTLSPGGRLRWLARSWLLPLSIVAHTPRILRHTQLPLRQRLGATGTLVRLRLWRFAHAHRLMLGRSR